MFPVDWDFLLVQFPVGCSVLTLSMPTLLDGGLCDKVWDVYLCCL